MVTGNAPRAPTTQTGMAPASGPPKDGWHRAVRLGQMARLKRAALGLAGVDGHLVGDRAGLRVCSERALDTLHPAFQPIVDWSARRVIAYEALMRSAEPMLPHPGAVLGAAERLDRVFDVGRAMRARTVADAARLPGEADIFVNLHPRELLDDELYDAGAPLSEHAGRVVLEITERATLDHVPNVEARVARLRKLGFRLAIDDLGAGYAGLNSLVQLQPSARTGPRAHPSRSLQRGSGCANRMSAPSDRETT